MYNRINFELEPGSAAPNNAVMREKLPAVRCPSDSSRQPSGSYGPTNYLACRGTAVSSDARTYSLSIPVAASGEVNSMFRMNNIVRIRDVEDGTTNTMMVSETFASAPLCTEQPSGGACPTACTSLGGNTTGAQQGYSWMWGQLYESHYYGTVYTPNSPTPDCGGGSSSTSALLAARSKHVGGVHVLLGDGSTRFASENIDINIWRNLGNYNDGNVMGEW